MERVTFHREDVRRLLSTMVCMKVDAGGNQKPPLAKRFNVRGFPTLVLISPTGKTLYHQSGAPQPWDFADFFAVDRFNKAVRAYNHKEWEAAASYLFFVTKWFGETDLGKRAKKLVKGAEHVEAFAAGLAAAKKKHAERLEARRSKYRAKEEERRRAAEKKAARRKLAAAAKAEADALYKKYLRSKAFRLYRKIILEYPEQPEAAAARMILRKHKKKWKEPDGSR